MTAEVISIVAAFVLGVMFGAVAGVTVYTIAKASQRRVR